MSVEARSGVRISSRAVGLSAGSSAALFIHGLNANMAFWHPALVAKLRDARRLVMYDQRGHGYSDQPPTGYTSLDLAQDALAVMDEHGLAAADVVAHSFGATVALQLVRLRPDRVKSLVILDGRARLLQPELRLRDWSEFPAWNQHFARAGIELDPELEVDFSLPSHLGGEMWAKVRAALEAEGYFVPRGGKRGDAKYRRLLAETTAPVDFKADAGLTRESLRRITQPCLLVYGSISAYLPTRDGLLNEIPGCRSVVVPGGGHNFPYLRPDETAQAISRHWTKS
jgi:2-hydroxy-6-oxonona-2,4-dienedioate hydrolase/2-succinyl-6-hydroxy-2,4-cyclohexadiene-1-carboxylate synthase